MGTQPVDPKENQPTETLNDPGLEMAFPPIGEDDPSQEPEPEGTPSSPGGLPDVEVLRTELATLRESYEKQRQRDQELIDRLIQGQSVQAHAQPRAEDTAVKFDDLPDPVDKPDDFRRALAQKFETALAQRERQQSTVSQRQQVLDSMWNRFQAEHPDLAKRQALVQGAAAFEANMLRQSGIDTDTYIRSNPDGFISRVVQRMREELGEGEAPKDTGRTAGVSGGTVSQSKAKAAPKAPGFIEQMRKAQMEDGLY